MTGFSGQLDCTQLHEIEKPGLTASADLCESRAVRKGVEEELATLTYYIATVWVEGGRMGDGIQHREIVRLAASSIPDFRASVDALMAGRFVTSVGRDITLTFGPISEATNQQP